MAATHARARRTLSEYAPLVMAGLAFLAAALAVGLFLVGDKEMVDSLIQQYGLLALFCVLILEGAMLLYFAPSEALVPTGIALLATRPGGQVSLPDAAAVILVAVAGATLGQYGLFLLAKRGGREYLTEKPWFRVSDATLDRFDRWFDRWGRAAVPVSNALLFTRGMLTVPAGFAEMRTHEFVALSALGSLAFQTWLALATYGLFSLL